MISSFGDPRPQLTALLIGLALSAGCMLAELDSGAFDDCVVDGDCGPTEGCRRVDGVRECVTVRYLAQPGEDVAALVARAEEDGMEAVGLRGVAYPPLTETLVLPDGLSLFGGLDESWEDGEERTQLSGPSPVIARHCDGDVSGTISRVSLSSPERSDGPAIGLLLRACGPRIIVQDIRVASGEGQGCVGDEMSCEDPSSCGGGSAAVLVDGGAPELRGVDLACEASAPDVCLAVGCDATPILADITGDAGD